MAEQDDFRELLRHRILRHAALEEQLTEKIAELSAERDLIRGRRDREEELFSAEFGALPSLDDERLVDVERFVPRVVGPYTGLSWTEAMVGVLETANRPLHVREIWGHLQEGGFETDARDPVRSVVSIAVRGSRFFKVGPNTYALGHVRAAERGSGEQAEIEQGLSKGDQQ